ncbi:MAG: CoA transferase [Chloroflexi bacterium]|nr:CoA transferase [Chloroflexota bacterium]
MAKLLDGLKVLDFTWALSGPFCTMTLADLGARVIKVEVPESGEGFRRLPPFINGQSAYFTSMNRGKQGLTLDLKHPKAIELAKRLAAKVDIFVENFRPGVMPRLGLGYDDLSATNPGLIYLSVSGFGQTGPYANRPAFDVVVQALSGIMSINGQEGGEPTRVGTSIGDIVPGMYGAIGILAALYRRTITGKGCYIDVGMMDGLVAIIENAVMRYWATGENPAPIGSRHPVITPFQPYPTADGYVVIAVVNNELLWRRLCRVLGVPELPDRPEFATNDLRNQHVHALNEALSAQTRGKSTTHWMKALQEADIPCATVNTVADLFKDPQVQARNMLVEIEQPGMGRPVMPGTPIKARGYDDAITRPAPGIGEHTDLILSDLLGMSEEEVSALHVEGVL